MKLALNPLLAAVAPPPIAEAHSWIEGRRFPAEKPLIDVAQAVPGYPPPPALTDHLAALGAPSWYARFAAQAMADPTYRHVVTKDALTSPLLVQTIDGINRCLPNLPKRVRSERGSMARNLLMHTCAEHEGALAEPGSRSRSAWPVAGEGLVDAIVGLWRAPVHVSAAGD